MTIANDYQELPVPADIDSIIAYHDGQKWIRGILRGSLRIDQEAGFMTCTVRWTGDRMRQITIGLDQVRGWQTDR